MFGVNYGYAGGWGQYQAYQQAVPNYNPWSAWSNNLAVGGNSSGFPTPYSQSTWDAVDNYIAMGAAPNQAPQMQQTADYMRRLQVMQALGPDATRRIPNWKTMPFNDFLIAAARLKGINGGNTTNPNAPQGQRLPVDVSAHSYYENGERVLVTKVIVWDLGATEQNSYNSNGQYDFSARLDKGVKGKRYRVSVEWANGRTYSWDHTNNGSPIQVWRPNQ